MIGIAIGEGEDAPFLHALRVKSAATTSHEDGDDMI